MFTLDKLKRGERALSNRCFLCEEEEETMDHLLVHRKQGCCGNFFWLLLVPDWCSLSSFGRHSLCGKGLGWERSIRKCGRQPHFVFFGQFSVKGTWWLMIMKPSLLRG